MTSSTALEVTITHNLKSPAEVVELFKRKLIALDWGRKGDDPEAYPQPRAKQDVRLFNKMRVQGAAVIAAYKGATLKRHDRLVGWIEPGADFVRLNGLLCLPLTNARVVDSSTNFLGNLPPRQCTLQPCHKRARGKLVSLVRGTETARSVSSLHNHDVEWLVTNFLIAHGLCLTVWSGGRSFENIDHAGYTSAGRVLLAQTTVSRGMVGKKATRLLELESPTRDLVMFGPDSARAHCPATIRYYSIEDVFAELDSHVHGRWLIDLMLNASSGFTEPVLHSGDEMA